MEDSPTGQEMLGFDLQLFHDITIHDVDAAAAIYQDSGEASSSPLRGKGGLQDQSVRAQRRHYFWVISPALTDWPL